MRNITKGAVAALCIWATAAIAEEPFRAQISTGGVTGTYYVIASPLAKFVAEKSNIKLTPSTSGGGPENLRRVSSGQAKFGMTQPDTMFEAWNGLPPFDKPLQDWRTVGIVTPVMVNHVLVRADSGIKTAEDLAGKTFAVGAPGSGSAVGMTRFLDAIGAKDKVDARMLPHQDYPDMLQDGKIDAFSRLGSIPAAVVDELSAQFPVDLVDFGSALKGSDFFQKYPYYEPVTVPAGTYKGVDHVVTMFGNAGYIIVNKDVPDDVVYEFTRLAYSPEAVARVTMAFKGVNLDAKNPLVGNIGPLHPGARKFWEEQGVAIPDPTLK
jgi:TRAP transporter TAXI family solute receptor